ncbi:hypothetical protein [Rhodococcus marinonascens]|uniref:hypothetical protein n=1 Tax=Rhodococcus marinonascens TaxID=38311 RepID=UPI000933E157|nr:hypothetical protein [Rhodococcus marinonascens]
MRNVIIALGAGALALAGCADTVDDNTGTACADFETAHDELFSLSHNGKGDLTLEQWTAAKADAVSAIDAAGLSTSNSDVKERMVALASAIPVGTVKLMTSKSVAEEFNANSAAVVRACEAANSSIDVQEIAIDWFMGP